MKHSADCIYHPNVEAPPPRPGALVTAACCVAGRDYIARRTARGVDRRIKDDVRRSLGLRRNKDGSWE